MLQIDELQNNIRNFGAGKILEVYIEGTSKAENNEHNDSVTCFLVCM